MDARKRRMLWVGLIALILVAGIAYWAWPLRVPDPVYKEKPLSYWLDQLPMTMVMGATTNVPLMVAWMNATNAFTARARYQPVEKSEDAIRAIRAMGTNAMPLIMARLAAKDSKFKQQILNGLNKLGIRRQFMENPGVKRSRAMTALLYLQPLPEDVMAQVRPLATNADTTLVILSRLILEPINRSYFAREPTNTTMVVVIPGR